MLTGTPRWRPAARGTLLTRPGSAQEGPGDSWDPTQTRKKSLESLAPKRPFRFFCSGSRPSGKYVKSIVCVLSRQLVWLDWLADAWMGLGPASWIGWPGRLAADRVSFGTQGGHLGGLEALFWHPGDRLGDPGVLGDIPEVT